MIPTSPDEGLYCCEICGAIVLSPEEMDRELCSECWEEMHGRFQCVECGAIAYEDERTIPPLCWVCDQRLMEEYLAERREAQRAEEGAL